MIITTKFDLKQLVGYLHDTKIQKGLIQRISISYSDCSQEEYYSVDYDRNLFRWCL